MSRSIDSLIQAASFILCKFSDGEEDYAGWRNLADALLDVTTSTKCGELPRHRVEKRLKVFNERLNLLESELRVAEIS